MIIAWPMIIAWYGFMAVMSHVARAAIIGHLALASGTVRSVPPELWGTQSEGLKLARCITTKSPCVCIGFSYSHPMLKPRGFSRLGT